MLKHVHKEFLHAYIREDEIMVKTKAATVRKNREAADKMALLAEVACYELFKHGWSIKNLKELFEALYSIDVEEVIRKRLPDNIHF